MTASRKCLVTLALEIVFAGLLLLLLLLGLLLLKTAKCHRLADDDRKAQRNGDESARQSVGRSVGRRGVDRFTRAH